MCAAVLDHQRPRLIAAVTILVSRDGIGAFAGMRIGDPTRTAREVGELYNLSVWNDRNFDLAIELVADTMIRHEVGSGHRGTFWSMYDELDWTSILSTAVVVTP